MPKHVWRRDDQGRIDDFAHDYENHNGPVCEVCGESFCEWCDPGCYDSECEGSDEP